MTFVGLGGVLLGLLLGYLGAWSATRAMLRDLHVVAWAARRLAEGYLDQRTGIVRDDPIGLVALAFDGMAARLAERRRQADQLTRLSQGLQTCRSSDGAYSLIATAMAELLPRTSGALHAMNEATGLYDRVASWGPEGGRDDRTWHPPACRALRRGRPHEVRGRTDSLCGHVTARDPSGQVCLPVKAQRRTVGLLHVRGIFPFLGQSERGGRNRTPWEIAADQIGPALDNLRLQERLREDSIRDPLTGLFNRRYLDETARRELARAKRMNRPVALVLFDLDHFKRLNDTFGHEAGDSVLRAVGEVLRHCIRSSDMACRYGGEELVLVLLDCPLDAAAARAREIAARVRSLRLHDQGRALGPITLSAGVAAFPEHGGTAAELLSRADRALYEAKEAGRDRVIAPARHRPRPSAADVPAWP